MPLGLGNRGQGYDAPYFRSLPIDEQLARLSLQNINPGPDGVESMRQCQCSMEIYEVEGYESFLDWPQFVQPLLSASGSAKPSPLLALPHKLRAIIFALAVTFAEPIPIRPHTTTTSPLGTAVATAAAAAGDSNININKDDLIARRSWSFFCPPLLRTCQQAEKEATALFYARNAFKAEVTDGNVSALVTWLRATGPEHLKLVPKLVIGVEVRGYFDLESLRRRRAEEDEGRSVPGEAGELRGLGRLLVGGGFGGVGRDRVVMVDLTVRRELVVDAYWLGRGTRDAEGLVRGWFGELRRWVDCEEDRFGAVDEGEGEGGDVGEVGKGEGEEVGLVTGKTKKLVWPRGKKGSC
ncbi:hypothetical protein B0A55_02361 [Friedmanniomyces simplex]|uniref:Uncharacterized protein n=1 Tax=Friedmanniomyces simplex TaxID=329884 RepID=A0A4U0XXN7_9PEZI|nr:hypothetical protein B0A55_02361 [Friedmanniomyces simplex]